ncbi:DUF3833 domain-containing protein [Gilvimarinus xylanilyticus]|uniref:DUF3833 domain-containing protein n=1 Tax=Gilvimarinus xylanilyticus TaxID=2944139 RepID=A0A9X2KSM1_9GAMM|nr:DUF3833 domain-containing protein [Gilvimarinus xylanilyticus]MCP8897958.1 DUF3833 domain-containing protein [Gilvimarinus xylanilyticus]
MNKILLILSLVLLQACAGPEIQDYQGREPAFAPQEFFNGPLTAHGVLKDRAGLVTRTFNADIEASWQDGVGTLEEKFEFDDGEIQYRTWTLTPAGKNRYTATAGDVIGPGTASVAGNAFNLQYTLEIDYRGDKLTLAVDDWMWRVSDEVVINQSTLKKWGFTVGSIQLVIRKLDDQN